MEVVRLPGVRREHDRDALLSEATGPEDERRVADAAVVGGRRTRSESVRASQAMSRSAGSPGA
jgi:hypothetical protein